MKRAENKNKKVCFDVLPIASLRRCSAGIPFNFVPQLRPKKEKETPSPFILSISENMIYYSDDEKNRKNNNLKLNRKILKIIKPSNTKSSKQVGYKKIISCCVKDEKKLKWEEDIPEMPINYDNLEEENLFIGAKGNVNLFPRSRASIFKAIEKKQFTDESNTLNSKSVIRLSN